ncbi:transposase [Streptomyces griseoflavus]|uniref:transposase n=1 Tax=Streptomyces griseoflavus TaxID=35619 RepID=UPI003D72F612
MLEPFSRADQRRWGGVCLRGLPLDGGRESVEPMAARLGEDGNRKALAHFVTSGPWDAAHVRCGPGWPDACNRSSDPPRWSSMTPGSSRTGTPRRAGRDSR